MVSGIQLLITTKVSYSLVLLTANLEDIKKIARQFVSETVADQIGKLFVHTTDNHTVNISEENNLNNDVNKVSSETFEVPRANKTSNEDVEKILKEAMQRVKEMKDVVQDVTKRQKKPEKEKRKPTKDNTKPSTKTSDYYTYDFILTPEKTIKPKYEWKKGLNFDFLSTPNIFKENQIYQTFTRGILSDREGYSDNRIEHSSDQTDRRYEKSNSRLEPKIHRLKYKPEKMKRNKKLETVSTKTRSQNITTKSNLLDYYDNSIYIKKEIIATSGPIDLIKVTAVKELSSSSSEYSLDKENKDKNVNVDLYFRKLLDSKLKQYKNDTKEIKAQIANITFNTSNKFFDKTIVTTKGPLKVANKTKSFSKKVNTKNNPSYLDENYDLYYSK